MSKKENRSKPKYTLPEDYTLLDFLKTFGIQSTTNFDLLEMAEYLGLLDMGGWSSGIEVIMKDELKDSLKEFSAHREANQVGDNAHHNSLIAKLTKVIINLNNKNQKGSHWVALYVEVDSSNDKAFYFDSFGLKPLEEIYEMFSSKVIEDFYSSDKDQSTTTSTTTTTTNLIYNKEVVQHYETEICGQLCIYFLFKMNAEKKDKNARFKEIISELKDLYDRVSLASGDLHAGGDRVSLASGDQISSNRSNMNE